MDLIKLAGIRDWPSPTTVKQTRSFLGFGNYYRRFISRFAEIARPLHELTKKGKIWNWTNECQTTFETLKERFSTAPVLIMPDTTKPFVLETDASKWAIGAMLLQKQEDGQIHLCGYLSHTLMQTKQNWQIYDRELYAIIYALDCYNTVRTPTLCKPDTSDRPLYCSPLNLLNLATPLLSYVVRLVLLILVSLSSLPCYLYDAVLILTSDTLYSLIDTFLSILRYISTHVFVVEP
jgi:hypothetical protein